RRTDPGGADLSRDGDRLLVDLLDQVGDGRARTATDLGERVGVEGDDGGGGRRGRARQLPQQCGDGLRRGGDLDLDEQRRGGHLEQLGERGGALPVRQQHGVELGAGEVADRTGAQRGVRGGGAVEGRSARI